MAPRVPRQTSAAPQDGEAPFTVRDIPSNEQVAQDQAEALAEQPKGRISVKTVHRGRMWDPEQSQWITDEGVLAKRSSWLQVQMDAGKIAEAQE